MAEEARPTVWVLGAGAIGLYVGGCLAAAGTPVHWIGRRSRLDDLRTAGGLRLTNLEGRDVRVPLAGLSGSEAPSPDQTAPDLVLLCVKSRDTAEAMRALASAVPAGTPVLSLQNGVDNVDIARRSAPALTVLAGMVPFNVARRGPGHYHQGTAGQMTVQDDAVTRRWAPAFAAAGLPLKLRHDMPAVQWAKLLLNLNNPVNALSGLGLRDQLLHPGWRRCTALLMQEALQVLKAAGIQPARLTPLPPHALPWLMQLPTPLFRLAAARLLRIDPHARSSMADDVAAGRPTEIDALCGAVDRLAARHGLTAPRQRHMIDRLQPPVQPLDDPGPLLQALQGLTLRPTAHGG